MINIFKNQKPFAKNDQKALAKNENFSKFKSCNFLCAAVLGCRLRVQIAASLRYPMSLYGT